MHGWIVYNGYEYLRALLRGEEEINGSRSLCLSLSRIVIGWFIRDRVRVKLWIQFLFSFSVLFFFFFSFLSIYFLFQLIIWQLGVRWKMGIMIWRVSLFAMFWFTDDLIGFWKSFPFLETIVWKFFFFFSNETRE